MDDSRTNGKQRILFSLRGLGLLFVGIAMGLSFSRFSSSLRPRVLPNEAYAFDLPEYLIEPPDVVKIKLINGDGATVLNGDFLVGPDGTVNLGRHGSVCLAGCSISESQTKILAQVDPKSSITLEIVGYNSKVYYIIHDARGGDEVIRIPYTGTETVLDALAVYREADVSKQNIWISRPTGSSAQAKIIPVDFQAITTGANLFENYQLLPGDRLFVSSKTGPVAP